MSAEKEQKKLGLGVDYTDVIDVMEQWRSVLSTRQPQSQRPEKDGGLALDEISRTIDDLRQRQLKSRV